MTNSDTLNLSIIEGGDAVSPAPINENFLKLELAIALLNDVLAINEDDTTIDLIENDIERHTQNIANLQTSVQTILTTLQNINTTINSHTVSIGDNSTNISTLNEALESAVENLTNLIHERVRDLNNSLSYDINGLETQEVNHYQEVSERIGQREDAIRQSIAIIENKLPNNTITEINGLKSRLTTIENKLAQHGW